MSAAAVRVIARDVTLVTLRAATVDDCEQVYGWSCAPDVRAVSGSSRAVTLAEHEGWYRRRLAAALSPMWIVAGDGEAVGVVRLDAEIAGAETAGDETAARISIALAARARGLGIGRRAIAAATTAWGRPVTAAIHHTNTASRQCFEACGFHRVGTAGEFDHYSWSPR